MSMKYCNEVLRVGPRALKNSLKLRCEEKPNGCWIWTGPLSSTGYPLFRKCLAHRLAFCVWKYVLQERYDTHHCCENKRCINPDHLLALTRSEHMKFHYTDPARGKASVEGQRT